MRIEPAAWPAAAMACLLAWACAPVTPDSEARFERLVPSDTGVRFANTLEDEPEFNILDYLYFYDGGGVALGDINRDGLPELFLTGNQVPNRLYLNTGNLRFEDITETAGILHEADHWSTGATMADVNGDGWLDIYVCQVHHRNKRGHNLLYINNGDLTFREEAAAYGLDFEGLSTQAAFLDYDRDGDLDLYLLNHAVHTQESFVRSWRRTIDAPRAGDRLYRNDGDFFVNVTSEAGIFSSQLGYGLGLAISDINQDGWPDIYVGNDFHENDYLYFNNGDGTFAQALQRVIGHTSQSTMGVDIADVNNDGRADILALDMLPPDLATYRRSAGPDPEDVARIKRDFGYAPQHARNTLQLHRGYDEEGYPLYSEIGIYAGIHATDWSWAGLFADLDNDSWKDIFVTNGIPGRPNDLDYLSYTSEPAVQRTLYTGSFEEQLAVSARMPPLRIANYAFRNGGDLKFEDVTARWGLDEAGYYNGATYGDLDGDGDLDLVVSNINEAAWIYRNNSGPGNHLQVTLVGNSPNTTGIGARVLVHAEGRQQMQEQMPTRGFQSSVAHVLHFGLGEAATIDSVLVHWPSGAAQTLNSVSPNQRLVLREEEAANARPPAKRGAAPLFRANRTVRGLDFRHQENEFYDYSHQPLLPHRLSTRGPALAVADVDGNGLDDVFLGGAHGQPGSLFLQRTQDEFTRASEQVFEFDADSEDVGAAFLDANLDGDPDLYVVSGGGQFKEGDPALEDRLYLNTGGGIFERSRISLPRSDGCCVAASDFDSDGDLDLFVGSYSVPGSYGKSPASHLLRNDGAGVFTHVAEEAAPTLPDLGMVTGAVWADITGSEASDLVVVGEWMPVTVLENAGGRLLPAEVGLGETSGWWRSVVADDFDADGDVDLVAGNLGLNAVVRAPLELYVGDFDQNGASDPVVAALLGGTLYTWARREDLLRQIPPLAQVLLTNESYANASLHDVIDDAALEASLHQRVDVLASLYLENQGPAGFSARPLPAQVQWSPLMTMLSRDLNGDGWLDLLFAGNFYGANSAQGRYDASLGGVLLGDGNGQFSYMPREKSGLGLRSETRSMDIVSTGGAATNIIVAINNAHAEIIGMRLR